jgi:hypothetical protein
MVKRHQTLSQTKRNQNKLEEFLQQHGGHGTRVQLTDSGNCNVPSDTAPEANDVRVNAAF